MVRHKILTICHTLGCGSTCDSGKTHCTAHACTVNYCVQPADLQARDRQTTIKLCTAHGKEIKSSKERAGVNKILAALFRLRKSKQSRTHEQRRAEKVQFVEEAFGEAVALFRENGQAGIDALVRSAKTKQRQDDAIAIADEAVQIARRVRLQHEQAAETKTQTALEIQLTQPAQRTPPVAKKKQKKKQQMQHPGRRPVSTTTPTAMEYASADPDRKRKYTIDGDGGFDVGKRIRMLQETPASPETPKEFARRIDAAQVNVWDPDYEGEYPMSPIWVFPFTGDATREPLVSYIHEGDQFDPTKYIVRNRTCPPIDISSLQIPVLPDYRLTTKAMEQDIPSTPDKPLFSVAGSTFYSFKRHTKLYSAATPDGPTKTDSPPRNTLAALFEPAPRPGLAAMQNLAALGVKVPHYTPGLGLRGAYPPYRGLGHGGCTLSQTRRRPDGTPLQCCHADVPTLYIELELYNFHGIQLDLPMVTPLMEDAHDNGGCAKAAFRSAVTDKLLGKIVYMPVCFGPMSLEKCSDWLEPHGHERDSPYDRVRSYCVLMCKVLEPYNLGTPRDYNTASAASRAVTINCCHCNARLPADFQTGKPFNPRVRRKHRRSYKHPANTCSHCKEPELLAACLAECKGDKKVCMTRYVPENTKYIKLATRKLKQQQLEQYNLDVMQIRQSVLALPESQQIGLGVFKDSLRETVDRTMPW
jgi:hypothetical protein